MQELAGKNAFITGGANGIGRAIADSLAREGVAVAIADVNEEAASIAAKEIETAGGRAISLPCDVTSEDSLDGAADAANSALGPIHLLFNNAGAFNVARLEETTRADWEWLLEINVVGVVNGLHTFLPRMRAHGEPAHVVNTASVSGHVGYQGLSIYTATKFAVVGLTESLRAELRDTAIGVSVLCPGIVKTGLLESSREFRASRHGVDAEVAPGNLKDVVNIGTDPAELGDQVVRGLRAGDFYILTHPTTRPGFEARFDEILGSFRG